MLDTLWAPARVVGSEAGVCVVDAGTAEAWTLEEGAPWLVTPASPGLERDANATSAATAPSHTCLIRGPGTSRRWVGGPSPLRGKCPSGCTTAAEPASEREAPGPGAWDVPRPQPLWDPDTCAW